MSVFSSQQFAVSLFYLLQGSPGVVTCMDNQPHGLQTGQSVIFKEVNGMVELNGTSRQVSGIRNLHDIMICAS